MNGLKRAGLALVALVVMVLAFLPVGAMAQGSGPPAALPGILNNPILLMAIGMIIKFVPGVRDKIVNKIIPYLLAGVAWIGALIAPGAAHAWGGPLALPAMGAPHIALFGIGFGFLGGLGGAVWSAAQAWALNEMFVRHMTKKPVDSI